MRGASQVQIQSPAGTPQIVVRLRKNDVARWGFDSLEVLEVLRTAYGGENVGQIYESNRVFDISLVLRVDSRPRMTEIGALPLHNLDGNYVTLKQLADIYESSA
jgi:Cu/Ag efflux pump CusA